MDRKGVCVVSAQKVTEQKPMLEKVYDALHNYKQPKTFYELANQVFNKKSTLDKSEAIARLYTSMNIDGRFLSIGDNYWGLKSWYPLEQREEDVAVTLAPKRKKKKKKDDEDFDDYDELDEADKLDDDFDDVDDDFDDKDYDEDLDDDDDDDNDDEDEDSKPKAKKAKKKK